MYSITVLYKCEDRKRFNRHLLRDIIDRIHFCFQCRQDAVNRNSLPTLTCHFIRNACAFVHTVVGFLKDFQIMLRKSNVKWVKVQQVRISHYVHGERNKHNASNVMADEIQKQVTTSLLSAESRSLRLLRQTLIYYCRNNHIYCHHKEQFSISGCSKKSRQSSAWVLLRIVEAWMHTEHRWPP